MARVWMRMPHVIVLHLPPGAGAQHADDRDGHDHAQHRGGISRDPRQIEPPDDCQDNRQRQSGNDQHGKPPSLEPGAWMRFVNLRGPNIVDAVGHLPQTTRASQVAFVTNVRIAARTAAYADSAATRWLMAR